MMNSQIQQLINLLIDTIALIIGWRFDSVANIAALATVDDTQIPDGSTKQVRTLWDTFTLNKSSTEVVDGITIVATMSGDGRWIRTLTPVPVWSRQATWFINATTGNDENDGLTSCTALATFAEFQRRVQPNNVSVEMSVKIESDLPATDPISMCCGGQALTVEGSPTVVYMGAVNTFTRNAAANEIGNLNAAGWTVADHVHRRIRFTSGAANGMVAFVLKDLGGNSARITAILEDGYGYGGTAVPAPGDTFVVETMPLVSFRSFAYDGVLNIGNLKNQDPSTQSPPSIHSTWFPSFKSVIGDLGVIGYIGIASNCMFGFLNANAKSLYIYSGAFAAIQQNYSDLRLYLDVVVDADIPSAYKGCYLYDGCITTVENGDLWLYGDFGTHALICGVASGFRFDSNRRLRGDITGTTRLGTFDDGGYIYTVNNDHSLALLDIRFTRANVIVDLNTECPLVDPHSGSFAGNAAGAGSGAIGQCRAGVKGNLTAGATVFVLSDLTENALEVPFIVTNRCIIRNLCCHLRTSPGSGEDVTVTVFVNGVATAITAQLDGDSVTGKDTDVSDITHSVLVHPQDKISFRIVNTNNGGFAAAGLSVSLECG